MTTVEETLYGRGFAYPLEVDDNGRLVEVAGIDLIWEAIECVIDSPVGTFEADPTYGARNDAYDLIGEINVFALRLGQAIVDCVPQIDRLIVTVVSIDGGDGTVYLDLAFTPIGTQTRFNRAFPFYLPGVTE